MNTSRWSRIILKMATGVVPATTPPMPKLILRNSQIINKITQVCQIFFMYLMLVLGGRIYTSLLYLAIVVVMVTLRLPLVMPHGQLFELWWLPTVCTVVPVIVRGIYLIILNGLFNFVNNVATSLEGPGWLVRQCRLVGLDEIVQVSWVRPSYQLLPDSVVVMTCRDDHRRWKIYRLLGFRSILNAWWRRHISCGHVARFDQWS